jgi:phosphate starvation-inducible protein PhoH
LSNKGKARRKAAQVESELANKKTEERKEFNVQVHKKKVLASILTEPLKVTPKTPNQKVFMKEIKDLSTEMLIGSGVAGCGKAHPLNTPVLTPDGFKTMGKIEVGDLVMTPFGDVSKVTGIFPQGFKDIYKLTFSDGTSTESCKEHLWETQDYNDRRQKRRGSVKSTEQIMSSLVYNNHNNHNIPITQPVNFSEKELPINPYLLGVLLGDGGLTVNVTLTSVDEEIVEKVDLVLEGSANLNKLKHDSITYQVSTKRGSSNPILDSIRELGLGGLKSENKFIPRLYKFSSVEQRIELLRGLMDTDGTVSKNGCKVEFNSVSQTLASDVAFLVESLGGVARMSTKQGSYKKDDVKIECQICYRVNISMNPEINPFSLKRKAERYMPRTKYKPARFIESIEYIGQKEAQCIMIDHPEHLYMVNNFIVTHNTFLALAESFNLLRDPNNNFVEIILFKSVTQLKGEETGFLPGDLKDKMAYINLSFFMQFSKLIEEKALTKLIDEGFIKVYPLGSIRGASLSDKSIVIVDEVQNLSIDNLHTVVTRMEEKSKLILIGDITQRDAPNSNDNALKYMTEHYRDIDNKIQIVEFTYEDVVRNELIKKLQWIYENNAPCFHKRAKLTPEELAEKKAEEAKQAPKLIVESIVDTVKIEEIAKKKKWFF